MGCAPAPAPPALGVDPEGLRVSAPAGLDELTLYDRAGAPILHRRFPAAPGGGGAVEATVPVPAGVEVAAVELRARGEAWRLPPPPGLADPLQIFVREGGALRVVENGEVLMGEDPSEISLELRATRPGTLGIGAEEIALAGGEHRALRVPVEDGRLLLRWDGAPVDLRWAPAPPGPGLDAVELVERVFPATAAGGPRLDRPADRVDLASPAGALLRRAVLGRDGPRDPSAPWAHEAVRLRNRGGAPVDLVIEARVVDASGAPHPAFAPRAREGLAQLDRVRALLRVPAGGEAVAVLPVYVDEQALSTAADPAPVRLDRELRLAVLGDPAPPRLLHAPLGLRRASGWTGLGLLGAGAAALGGAALLTLRGRAWLRELPTSALMGISLFSALGAALGALGTLLTMTFAAVLGPFAIFATGLVDEVLRTTLLAALLTLLPRPGVAGLSAAVQWLLLAAAQGGAGPVEVGMAAGRVFCLELALWAFGITRGGGRWRDGRAAARWARLGAALGGVGLWSSFTGFAVQSALYRMHYAGWYVAACALLPGLGYVLLACALAAPVADGLRRVQR